MSKDERWKQLLDLAGVLGSTTSGARANEPMASQMSFLFGGTNLSSAQPRQLTELTQAVSHDSGGLEFEDTDQSRILSDHIVQLSKQIQDLRQTAEKQTLSIENNTVVTQENTSTRAQHGLTSAAAGIGRTLSGIGSGLTLSPLIRGLTHLVKGGTSTGDTSPMPLYIPPAPFRAEGTISRHGDAIDEVSYGQAGLARRSGGEYGTSLPPITIQVNAIDSRSFMDHSEGIARAVREAMLNMHSLNDVVADL